MTKKLKSKGIGIGLMVHGHECVIDPATIAHISYEKLDHTGSADLTSSTTE
jgi:hypothetical protein